MEALKSRSAGSEVAFLYAYTREPHAGQRMMGLDFSGEAQPESIEQRRLNAKRCLEKYGSGIPWIVDPMDGRIQKAYGGLPNSAYLIRSDGVVAYKEAWADAARLEAEIAKLNPPAFYLAAEEERKVLLRIYEDALRLRRGKTAEARSAAATALAASRHPACLPRLGQGMLDPDPGVRAKAWELLRGLLALPFEFDPDAADEARSKAAAGVLEWLRAAEKTHRWDQKAGKFELPEAGAGKRGGG